MAHFISTAQPSSYQAYQNGEKLRIKKENEGLIQYGIF